jgi:hypothetical protein
MLPNALTGAVTTNKGEKNIISSDIKTTGTVHYAILGGWYEKAAK